MSGTKAFERTDEPRRRRDAIEAEEADRIEAAAPTLRMLFALRDRTMLCPNARPHAGDSGQSRRDVAAGLRMISEYRTTGRR
ncbi:hypothetical protein [Methylorubrum populi]|uniref:hypothetical protein n=1 Tax=Methylorubrum populi TaxID=223967 RepID=UPI0012FFB6D4|nr:hypothetical protein [Methylorubrum populi]